MPNIVTHRYFFSHPPAVVWEYLTNSELMALWLMPNNFQPIPGYDFEFRIKPVPALEFDGIVYCRVLEIVPFEKLSYTWKCGPGDGKITTDSLVVWTLAAKGPGTELFLEHTGFKETDLSMYAAVNEGWLKNIQKIDAHINAKYATTKP